MKDAPIEEQSNRGKSQVHSHQWPYQQRYAPNSNAFKETSKNLKGEITSRYHGDISLLGMQRALKIDTCLHWLSVVGGISSNSQGFTAYTKGTMGNIDR